MQSVLDDVFLCTQCEIVSDDESVAVVRGVPPESQVRVDL